MVRSDPLALAFSTVLLLYSRCVNPSRLDISSWSSCNHVSSGGLRKGGMWTPSLSLWFLSCLVLQTFTRFEMDNIFDKENKIFQKKIKEIMLVTLSHSYSHNLCSGYVTVRHLYNCSVGFAQ